MRILFFISPVRKFGGLSFAEYSKTKAFLVSEKEAENDFEFVITANCASTSSCHRLLNSLPNITRASYFTTKMFIIFLAIVLQFSGSLVLSIASRF